MTCTEQSLPLNETKVRLWNFGSSATPLGHHHPKQSTFLTSSFFYLAFCALLYLHILYQLTVTNLVPLWSGKIFFIYFPHLLLELPFFKEKHWLFNFKLYHVVVWLVCSCRSAKWNSCWQIKLQPVSCAELSAHSADTRTDLIWGSASLTKKIVEFWTVVNSFKIYNFLCQKLEQGIHIRRNRQLIPKKLRTADIDSVLLNVEFTLCCFVNGNLDLVLKPLFRLLHASWNSWLTTLGWAICLDGRITSSMLGSLGGFWRWKKTGYLVSGILRTLLSLVSICQWLNRWWHDPTFSKN